MAIQRSKQIAGERGSIPRRGALLLQFYSTFLTHYFVVLVHSSVLYLYVITTNLYCAGLAQSVERQALNLMVEGSSPSVGVYLLLLISYKIVRNVDPGTLLSKFFKHCSSCLDSSVGRA